MAAKAKTTAAPIPTLGFADDRAWEAWLGKHHESSAGVWLKLAKKGAEVSSVTYAEALETALCYGWIDGQKNALDASHWLQKFTPRGPRSIWSKINRDKIAKLTETGRIRPPGLAAVERAKKNGQWENAYDGPKTATVPAELEAALAKNKAAKTFFATLESRNRYAILWRIQTAKKPETRDKRIRDIVEMLARNEKFHP